MKISYTHTFNTHSGYIPGALRSKRIAEFFDLTDCNFFVETGTYIGDGVQWALDTGKFKHIYSVELSKLSYDISYNRFKDTKNVTLFHSNTLPFLDDLLPTIDGGKKTVIYLDAHQSNNQLTTYISAYPVPLLQESKIILDKFSNLDNLLVVIDDEGCWSIEMINSLVTMYRSKGMVDCYMDDSIIFCKKEWIK
jgi:hypothetical protein